MKHPKSWNFCLTKLEPNQNNVGFLSLPNRCILCEDTCNQWDYFFVRFANYMKEKNLENRFQVICWKCANLLGWPDERE